MRTLSLLTFIMLTRAPSFGGIIAYEGNSFPENQGWERIGTLDAERSIDIGWFYHAASTPGQLDAYQRSLAEFAGTPAFFVEWRVETNANPSLLDLSRTPVVLSLGGTSFAHYHMTFTDGLVVLNRSSFIPSVYAAIGSGESHSFRLELFGGQLFRWLIDGAVVDSGVPVAAYPTGGSELAWGIRHFDPGHTARWDYIRYGTIPRDASGDYDSSDTVDLFDYYFARECFADPDYGSGPSCRFIDLDADGHADLLDFAEFQNAFGQSADYEK